VVKTQPRSKVNLVRLPGSMAAQVRIWPLSTPSARFMVMSPDSS
jgi:hypothetical protein